MTPRDRVLTALRCEVPDCVPFLESVIDGGVALALLGRPAPKAGETTELGVGDEPVFQGELLGSDRYDVLELVDSLGLDGFGTYLFLAHEGVQEQAGGHTMVHGGRIKTRPSWATLGQT